MRYLVNIKNGAVTTVTADDDQKFYKLVAERDDDGRQVYEQTGPQDPRVTKLEVPGQVPANGEQVSPFNTATGDPVDGDKVVPASPAQTLVPGTQTPKPASAKS